MIITLRLTACLLFIAGVAQIVDTWQSQRFLPFAIGLLIIGGSVFLVALAEIIALLRKSSQK